jgi:hypothetical protein
MRIWIYRALAKQELQGRKPRGIGMSDTLTPVEI